jgi:ABC-2 type transport system ATP-binding protein
MIEIRALSHRYEALQALDGVQFDVPPGRLVGLVGPNGAGKTTLIRAVVTLLRPTGGFVRVGGLDTVRDAARVRALLAYLPERASPYPELTAWEHLDLFARIAGHEGARRDARIRAALDSAALGDRADSPCATLSKGLRQRLALEAALLHDPRVLVLDEPTDGLDPDSREHLLARVRERADRGDAVLLSSHVLAELEDHADEVVILAGGRMALPSTDEAVGEKWSLTLREDPAEALAALRDLPGVLDLEAEGRSLGIRLRISSDTPDAADLVAHLVRAGLHLVELRRVEGRLRDRYRDAVRGEAP